MPRPTNHLELLFAIDSILEDITMAQRSINAARQLPITDNYYQLLLDRKQAELDEKKDVIAGLMVDVPRSN